MKIQRCDRQMIILGCKRKHTFPGNFTNFGEIGIGKTMSFSSFTVGVCPYCVYVFAFAYVCCASGVLRCDTIASDSNVP